MRRLHSAGVLAACACLTGCASSTLAGGRPDWMPNRLQFGTLVVTNQPVWDPVVAHAALPGALVINVLPGSPADVALVRPGDVVVGVNGTTVSDADSAIRAIQASTETALDVRTVSSDGLVRRVQAHLSPAILPASLENARGRLGNSADVLQAYILSVSATDPRSGLAVAQSITHDAPTFALGYVETARRLAEIGGRDVAAAAQDQIARATAIAPDSADVQIGAAEIQLRLGQPAAVRDLADRGLELDPGSSKANHLKGLALQSLGDVQGAVAAFEAATEADPYSATYWNALAQAEHADHRDAPAKAAAQRATALRTNVVPNTLAWQPVLLGVSLVMLLTASCAFLIRGRQPPPAEEACGRHGLVSPAWREAILASAVVSAVAPVLAPTFSTARALSWPALVAGATPGVLVLAVAVWSRARSGPPILTRRVAALASFLLLAPHVSLLRGGGRGASVSSLTLLQLGAGVAIGAAACGWWVTSRRNPAMSRALLQVTRGG